MFFDSLINEIQKKGAPICVGLDPQLDKIPEQLKKSGNIEEILFTFCKEIVDATADLVPVYKPQIAFFEQYGLKGLSAFSRVLKYIREKKILVIADVKRGDIGSTSEAYARAYFEDGADFEADAITINTYFGKDSVTPYEKYFAQGKAVFTQVKNSNPSSSELQDLTIAPQSINTASTAQSISSINSLYSINPATNQPMNSSTSQPINPAMSQPINPASQPINPAIHGGGLTVYETMGALVEKWGASSRGENNFSSIGAVVGATFPEQGELLRKILPHTFFLVPGYGAQGGKAEDLKRYANAKGAGIIVNSSRGIIFAYEKMPEFGAEKFAEAARKATEKMQAELKVALA
jgi:orotidine-5'-phosphate decarboxylase